jgi:type II secretory pathway pseudopilin PulG
MVTPFPRGPAGPPAGERRGYVFIMLLVLLAVLAIGLTVAYPVWRTQIQREKEEELIFRGRQYVEAVRLYQAQNPGRLPKSLRELYEKKFLRKLYPDPMVRGGEWSIILQSGAQRQRQRGGTQEVIVAPPSALAALNDPLIIGVVSSSTAKSFMIYNQQESYDKWLFFYGQDPKKTPTIIRLQAKDGGAP